MKRVGDIGMLSRYLIEIFDFEIGNNAMDLKRNVSHTSTAFG